MDTLAAVIAFVIVLGFVAVVLAASSMKERGVAPLLENSSEGTGVATVIRGGSDGHPRQVWVKKPSGLMTACRLLGGGQGGGSTRRVRFNSIRDAKVAAARIVY